MFFLGGFNTFLPHLLYLSVIWIFLIIGLSGPTSEYFKNQFSHNQSHVIFDEADTDASLQFEHPGISTSGYLPPPITELKNFLPIKKTLPAFRQKYLISKGFNKHPSSRGPPIYYS